MSPEDEYPVGYGKPPRTTQFVKGRSGNPRGRPKGTKNFATVIQQELRARVEISENGKRRTISKREAIAKQIVNKAASGDPKAIPLLFNETRPHEPQPLRDELQTEPQSPEDQMVIENIVKRILNAKEGRK